MRRSGLDKISKPPKSVRWGWQSVKDLEKRTNVFVDPSLGVFGFDALIIRHRFFVNSFPEVVP
jgi:hypothetical protein